MVWLRPFSLLGRIIIRPTYEKGKGKMRNAECGIRKIANGENAENFERNVPHFTRFSFSGFRIPHSAEDGVYIGRWQLICTHTVNWKMRQWCTSERTGHSPSYAEAKKMTYTHLHTPTHTPTHTHTHTHLNTHT